MEVYTFPKGIRRKVNTAEVQTCLLQCHNPVLYNPVG